MCSTVLGVDKALPDYWMLRETQPAAASQPLQVRSGCEWSHRGPSSPTQALKPQEGPCGELPAEPSQPTGSSDTMIS